MNSEEKKQNLKRQISLIMTVVFAVLIGMFFELELEVLKTLQFELYWQIGGGFFLMIFLFVLGIYGRSFLHLEKHLGMDKGHMKLKRSLHYLLHYFMLPTLLYFSLLTVLFFVSSPVLQQVAIWLSVFAFFSVFICVLKVVRCAPKGYKIPDKKKMHYYYICRVKFCFFYKLYVAFLGLTALYMLSMEHVIPVYILPVAVAVGIYILLMHNMMFTVSWEWKTQKKAILFALAMAVLSLLIRLGKVHFLIAGVALVTFYHIFEGFFFHKMSSVKKEILQKYILMGVLALLIVIGSFDLDISGTVIVPDESYSRISSEAVTNSGSLGATFMIVTAILAVVSITIYAFFFRRASKK